MRAWYNGSTSASQAEDEGSIPFARTKNQIGLAPISFLACGRGIEPDKRVRKQVDFASVTQRNRHGLPAGIYAKGIPSPAPPVFADAKPR